MARPRRRVPPEMPFRQRAVAFVSDNMDMHDYHSSLVCCLRCGNLTFLHIPVRKYVRPCKECGQLRVLVRLPAQMVLRCTA
jgi:hypothetical protein